MIFLPDYYIGHASNEQRIEPGLYAPGDPGLHGADAEYLVRIGKAWFVEDEAHRVDPTAVVGSEDTASSMEPDEHGDDPDDTLELTAPTEEGDEPPSKSVRKRR